MDQTLTGNYQLRKENGMDSVPVSSTSSTGNIFSLAGKSYLAKYCGIVLLLWSAVSGFADPASRIEIKVSATPPENLLKNADFEKGLSPWRTGRKSGVELCEGTAHSGKFSLKVTLDSSDRKKHISTKSFYCTRSNLKSPLRPGKSYIISGWMLANPDLRKPPMTYHGAGFSLSVYAKGWKKKANCHITSAGLGRWVHLVSKPVLIPEWAVTPEFHAGIFYV
ncbi:MAG: carbohydrate binding domain-containing protein, partial [Victivallales bacterium]